MSPSEIQAGHASEGASAPQDTILFSSILLAEDNPINVKLAVLSLWQHANDIDVAVNGVEGVKLAADHNVRYYSNGLSDA